MSNLILSVLDYYEKEKGISREDMVAAIVAALRGASQKGINAGQDINIEINPKTGALKAWVIYTVVDSVSDFKTEIHLEKARLIDPEAELGSTISKEIDPSYFGRIAAQTARQAINQRVRQFEKERLYDDYKDSVGEIVSGIVRRWERGDIIIDLGKAEAILPPKERIKSEAYSTGDRVRCLLADIQQTNRGPELILSRTDPRFVQRLFELEVTEITDGTVTIESISREPGYRTKLAVDSSDPKVDPVGACVGPRGARVKTIVGELGGEKIDIIRYYADPIRMLEEAIKPAIPKNIRVDDYNQRISFQVSKEHLSIAIGKRGQNARLTSRLLGWKLDIGMEQVEDFGFDEQVQEAIAGWHGIPGVDQELAKILVGGGFPSPEVFEGVDENDLVDQLHVDPERAKEIIQIVDDYRKGRA